MGETTWSPLRAQWEPALPPRAVTAATRFTHRLYVLREPTAPQATARPVVACGEQQSAAHPLGGGQRWDPSVGPSALVRERWSQSSGVADGLASEPADPSERGEQHERPEQGRQARRVEPEGRAELTSGG